MANTFDANGLQINTVAEDLASLIEAYQAIYGSDINVEANSPDGQALNIFAQMAQDIKELLVQINNSFDPDEAQGTVLDSRCAINYIQRKAATYTYTDITIIVDRATNLIGMDLDPDAILNGTGYTIADNEGNYFVLVESQSFVTAGTYVVEFRAKNIGFIQTSIGTITTPIDIILGVTSVNNLTSATITGTDEETDTALRIRRPRSVALASVGFTDSMYSSLYNLDDVQDVLIFENVTSEIDDNDIPPKSYWIIVLGDTDENVAQVIYNKRSGGTDMKGEEEVLVEQSDGSYFLIKFDRPVNEELYISFEVENITGDPTIDYDYVKAQMVDLISYKINQTTNKSDIEVVVKSILPNAYVKGLQVSNNGADYYDILDTTLVSNIFVLDVGRIDISAVS